MEETVRGMIETAEENEDYGLADMVYSLLSRFAMTINCPSNWRDLGTALAEEYQENDWVTDSCRLYEFEEGGR